MKRRTRRLYGVCWLILLCFSPSVSAAGSWVGQAEPVRAFMTERAAASSPMRPPPAVQRGAIHDVRWHYRTAPGEAVVGWLCASERCIELAGPRGQTQGLNGVPATTPLHFRFALAPGQRRAVSVGGLQIIVNYE